MKDLFKISLKTHLALLLWLAFGSVTLLLVYLTAYFLGIC